MNCSPAFPRETMRRGMKSPNKVYQRRINRRALRDDWRKSDVELIGKMERAVKCTTLAPAGQKVLKTEYVILALFMHFFLRFKLFASFNVFEHINL